MAHEINRTDRFGEVRSNGQRAWHGLGVEIPDGAGAVEGFRRIGLDWHTELLPVFADRVTAAGVERIEAPAHRLHVRSDTKRVLGMVSDGYAPVQNLELAEFADTMLGGDAAAVLETAGSLRDGQRVFALLRLPQTIVASRGDELATYAAITNGHGGYAAFCVYPTAIRIVCANTLRMSEKDLSRGARFLHTGDMAGKMRTAKLALGFAVDEIKKLDAQVHAMVARKLTAAELRVYMNSAFDAMFPRPGDTETEVCEKWLAKKTDVFESWKVLATTGRNTVGGMEGSVWQALNVITDWSDHQRTRAEDADARINSNLFGASHVGKAKALRLALELVK